MQKNDILLNDFYRVLAIFFVAFLLSFAAKLNAKERLYMMPYEQKEALQDLISSINSAKNTIDIAIYSFTNKEIAKALREANIRGVKINIIYDLGQKNTDNSTIGYLDKFENINTCLLEGKPAKNKKYNGIMHHKLIIIDKELIGIGSANWSKNAFENNYESLFFSRSKEVIQKAQKYYDDMLKECKAFLKRW